MLRIFLINGLLLITMAFAPLAGQSNSKSDPEQQYLQRQSRHSERSSDSQSVKEQSARQERNQSVQNYNNKTSEPEIEQPKQESKRQIRQKEQADQSYNNKTKQSQRYQSSQSRSYKPSQTEKEQNSSYSQQEREGKLQPGSYRASKPVTEKPAQSYQTQQTIEKQNRTGRYKPAQTDKVQPYKTREANPAISNTNKPVQDSRTKPFKSEKAISPALGSNSSIRQDSKPDTQIQKNKPLQLSNSQVQASDHKQPGLTNEGANLQPASRQTMPTGNNAQPQYAYPNDGGHNQHQGDNSNHGNNWNGNHDNNGWNGDNHGDNNNHNGHNGHDGWNDHHHGSNDNHHNEHYNWNDHHAYYQPDWNYPHYGWDGPHDYFHFGCSNYVYYNTWYPPHYWFIYPALSLYVSFVNGDIVFKEEQVFRGFIVANDWDLNNNLDNRYYQSPNFHWRSNDCPGYGFGIVADNSYGDYSFYHFDNYGSRLARSFINRYRGRNRKIFVEVTGYLNPNDHTIEVVSMHRIRGYQSIVVGWHYYQDRFSPRPHHWG